MKIAFSDRRLSGKTGVFGARWFVAAAGVAMVLASGCDPCAGIVGCGSAPRLSIEGQVVVHESREPASGVEILFERTGGAALARDSIVAVSNTAGRFRLAAEALELGEVVGRITVRPPGRSEYSVSDIRVETVEIRGDGEILQHRWVVDPYFDFLGELYSSENGKPIGVHSSVVFRRTGGIRTVSDTFATKTDFDGRFILRPEALEHGEIVGDITVGGLINNRYQERVIRGVRFSTTHVERPLAVRGVWYLGLGMNYLGHVQYRAGYRAAPDVVVRFQRTAGIGVVPESFTTRTDPAGRFPLRFEPSDAGVLVGDLTFEMGPPVGTITVTGVEIPTQDVAGERVFATWSLGPGLNYVGEVRGEVTGEPIVGAAIRLIRTGGIRVEEEIFIDTTNEGGRFRLMPFPLEAGEFEGRLVVDLPSPHADFTVDVTLPTFETDELRLAQVWYVPGL